MTNKKSTRLIESGGFRLKVKRGGKRYFFVQLKIVYNIYIKGRLK
jgi:hypothetical protein